ncbi:MFS transporter [Deinococcus wulumuqiensis]|uniref:MFS transporter n=5 Tax=Deinococcus wulumuqiensis TaxID=980427 RepID=A0AAV4K668_9DEIO|nr:MFS transporter [Deinococcus wulumuqiensis]QII20361.1 MFS transporter [Deinococcus wulumuqiensis R12]GGI82479.1 MFS transporter [Deinococcus wulumuqiensis]GGP29465.1 MFS transporter [Deinococcus wulumuqiensis]
MTGRAAGLRGRLPLHPGTLRRVLAGVLLLSCAEFVRSGLYAGYLPQVVGDLLGLPKADAVVFSGSAFTAHFIADTAMRGPAGAALLRFGLRPVVLAGAALSLLGLFLMSVTHTGWVLLLAAALHGAGFSPLWPAVMSLTTASAHSTHQGRVLTTVSMSVMPFIGLSVLTLGALADAPRSAVFGLCLGLLAASLALGLLLPQRLPAATAAPATPQGRRQGVRVAAQALAPLIPAAFLQTLTMALLGQLLFTLYKDLGLTYWGMVALLGLGGAVAFGSMPQTGKLADLGRARLAVTLGFACLAVALGGIALRPAVWALYPLAALLGLGYAFIAPGWAALVAQRLPEAQRPAAWGTLMTVENLGTSLGPLLGAFAYRTLGVPGPFVTGAALSLLAALGYVVFRRLLDTPVGDPANTEAAPALPPGAPRP